MAEGEKFQKLPFSTDRQNAVLGHLILSSRFFKQCVDRISAEWWNDVYSAKVWVAMQTFYREFRRHPLPDTELVNTPDFLTATQGDRNKMRDRVNAARLAASGYGLETLVPELTTWLKSRLMHELVMQGQNLFNAGKTDEAFAWVEKKTNQIKSASFTNAMHHNWLDYEKDFTQRMEDYRNALTIGLPEMDRLLVPEGMIPEGEWWGSLLPGDATLMMAPTNIGKSTVGINIIAVNFKRYFETKYPEYSDTPPPVIFEDDDVDTKLAKKLAIIEAKKKAKNVRPFDALFFSHEGAEIDLVEKVWCSVMNRSKKEIQDLIQNDPTQRRKMDLMAHELAEHLRYIHMVKPGLTVEDVLSAIRQEADAWILEHGKCFDLLVDDYPAKLITNQPNLLGGFAKRNLDEYVYDQFGRIADEYKFHALVFQQVNRTAAKINRGLKVNGHKEDRLLVPEDAHESFGPSQILTNVITINRSPFDEKHGFTVFHQCKSRSSMKGWTFICHGDWATANTHGPRFGVTWYLGNVPPGESVIQLFEENRGREVKDESTPGAAGIRAIIKAASRDLAMESARA